MANLCALLFCWNVAGINYFVFSKIPRKIRIGTTAVAFLAGCINIPFIIRWLLD
jgi:hypothetical protein